MRRAARLLSTTTAIAALAGAAAAAPAGAGAPPRVTGLHDARYCEIFEVRGALPDAEAIIWNTIGQGSCPADTWAAVDPAALAQERGATLVVLNGPRHFLMDAARARTGGRDTLAGLPMTDVARLPLRGAADLVQSSYTDRTVQRSNTWEWKAGRTLFQLVAPGGDVYVMQSYAQIVDPDLTIDDLPGLGRRLDLPAGWRFRARTAKRPFVLTARGETTILQDELRNTYQLASAPKASERPRRHRVRMDGEMKTVVPPPTPGKVTDRGTVSGTPFGDGTLELVGSFAAGRLEATVRMRFADGEVRASTSLPVAISGDEVDFRGTATITGGTGAYRGISGTVRVHDRNTLDGQNGVLRLRGAVRY